MEHRKLEREDSFMVIEGGKAHVSEEPGNPLDDRIYTVRDIEALPEGERAELIDGKMYRMAAPTLTHQDILGWLNMKIRMYITEKGGAVPDTSRAFCGLYQERRTQLCGAGHFGDLRRAQAGREGVSRCAGLGGGDRLAFE